MCTFHIQPETKLAKEAVEMVRVIHNIDRMLWIAVRGIEDDEGEQSVHTVCLCPDQDRPDKREHGWAYCQAVDWLRRYETHQQRLAENR